MIKLPFADPGKPDTRSPVRFLVWVGRQQLGTLLGGVFFGVVWMVSQALMPAAIGRAIQDGIVDDDNRALAIWTLILLALGATTAVAGVMRHRFAVSNWLQASFRMAQVVAHHAARTGHAIKNGTRPARSWRRSRTTPCARAEPSTSQPGSPARSSSYIVVAVILLSASVTLGLVVLLGVPVLVLLMGTVIKPLQARQARAARGGREADRARRGHRRRAPRAAGDRRRATRSSTATATARRRCGRPASASRCRSRPLTRRRSSSRASSSSSSPGSAPASRSRGRSTSASWSPSTGTPRSSCMPLRTAAEAVDKITRVVRRREADARVLVGRARRRRARAPRLRSRRSGVPLERPRAPASSSSPGSSRASSRRQPDEAAAIADRLGRFGDDDGVVLGDVRARRPADRDCAPADRRQRGGSGALLGHAALRARPLGPGRRTTTRSCGDRSRERRGRDRRTAGRPRRLRRRARPILLGRSAPAARTCARAALGRGGARPRRADERGRRTHGGPDRPAAPRGARGQDDRRHHGQPADARPDATASFFVEDGRVVAEGTHRELLRTTPAYRGRSRAERTYERAAADRRRATSSATRRKRLGRRHRRGAGRHGRPARRRRGRRARRARRCSAVSSSRCEDGTTRSHVDKIVLVLAGVPRRADDPHVVRAAGLVRALGARSSRSSARTSCAASSACRSRRSSAPAPATSSRARPPTSTRSLGRFALRSRRRSSRPSRRSSPWPRPSGSTRWPPSPASPASRFSSSARAGTCDRAPAGYLWERASYATLAGTVGETVEGGRTMEALGLREERVERIDADLENAYRAEWRTLCAAHGLVPDGRVRLRAARSPPRSRGAAGSSRTDSATIGEVTADRALRRAARRPGRPAHFLARRDPGRRDLVRAPRRDRPRAARPRRRRTTSPRASDLRAEDVRYAYVAEPRRPARHRPRPRAGRARRRRRPLRRGQVDARALARRHPPASRGPSSRWAASASSTCRSTRCGRRSRSSRRSSTSSSARSPRTSGSPVRGASDEQLVDALAAVDALEWVQVLPEMLDTVVGAGGSSADAGSGAAGRARPARARRSRTRSCSTRRRRCSTRAPRGTSSARSPRCSAAGPWSRSRTVCTPRTTPTAWRSSRTASSTSSGRTTSSSPEAARTPRSGTPGTATARQAA